MVFSFFYNLLWLIALILLAPVYIYRVLFKGKYRSNTLSRMGLQSIPNISLQAKSVWLHSVSLGESQISDQFAQALKAHAPDVIISASACTETGFKVLSDSKYIDHVFYYPADFTFLIKSIFKKLHPDVIFIMETDLWPSMLHMADKYAVPVYLINGKISESTFNIYLKLPWLKKLLLEPIEKFYLQCSVYKQRFHLSGVLEKRLSLTGNIKLDRKYPLKTESEKKHFVELMGLNPQQPILVFASTHEGEEQGFIEIGKQLQKKIKGLQLIYVPRHPERFSQVAQLLKHNDLSFCLYSEQVEQHKACEVLLLDAMGLLMKIYEICDVAVVAGSFTDKVGGHNIFEPAFFSKAIVYGPWIFKQPGFHDLIQEHQAAIQIDNQDWQDELQTQLFELLTNTEQREQLGKAAYRIVEASQGMTESLLSDLKQQMPRLFE